MLCLASTVTWVIYRSAQEAADTISNTALAKAAHYLHNAANNHLFHARITLNAIVPPYFISQQNALPAESGQFSFAPDLQAQLWTALHLFPDAGRQVIFCSKSGQYVGIAKINEHQYEIGLRQSGKEKWTVYSSTGPRQIGKVIRNESYDPRNQRWYRSAVDHDSEVWYAHRFGSEKNEALITLAKPIYAKDQTLLGVASAELSLSGITQVLNSIPVSQNGVAFLIDRSGKLIAASGSYPSIKAGMSKAAHFSTYAHSRLIRDAHMAFGKGKAVAGTDERVRAFTFISGHENAHAAAIELRDNGLDWILITAAPRADFNGELRETALSKLAIGLAAMMFALLIGYLTLRRALADIRRLTYAVKNIGRGESFQTLDIERSDEIGQLAKSFQQIERTLRTDKLTSVLNRDSVIAQIDFHCSVGREVDFLRFTILFIDLDGFKQINDLYGHDEGDRVLSESAQRLQDAVRKEDAVARFGGDEFVVYLHGVGEAATITAICEKIRTALEAPIQLRQGGIVHVGASIGHASFPEDGPNSDILLRVADNNMFYDKKMRKSTLQLPLE
jgi:diguanylate cyclase (GGDEF)-like protein